MSLVKAPELDIIRAVARIDAAVSGNEFAEESDRQILLDKLKEWVSKISEPFKSDLCQCPDCGANPGENHKPGCDVERCPHCGNQAILCLYSENDVTIASCDGKIVPDEELLKWSGRWFGYEDCEEYNFWCKWNNGWVPCEKGEIGSQLDMNRLLKECDWDRDAKRFVHRKE
jgi:hypothetical protein